MLYIVPKNSPSEQPIIDELTMKMVAALRKAAEDRYLQSYGFHTCVCGAHSGSRDLILPNGLPTNSLCVHYLAYHRAEIEAGEIRAVEGLSDGMAYPDSYELHGPGPLCDRHGRRVGPALEIDRLRDRYDARTASLLGRLVTRWWRFRGRLGRRG